MNLFSYKDKIYSTQELMATLKTLGINKNDDINIHSELLLFGKPLLSKESLCKEIISVFKEATNTIIMPTFTYSFCNNEIYDTEDSPTKMGILNEYFRCSSGVYRTLCPIFSFAIFGDYKKYISASNDVLGQDSIFNLFYKNKAKNILFGNIFKGYTFFHHIESVLQVPYRFQKEFKGIIKNKNTKYNHKIIYYVRHLQQKSEIDYKKLANFLLDNNSLKYTDFAGAKIGVIDLQKAHNSIAITLKENPYYFLRQ